MQPSKFMSVFRKLFGVLLAALLLGGALKVGGDLGNDPAIEGSLKPEKVHREAAEEIVERLAQTDDRFVCHLPAQ